MNGTIEQLHYSWMPRGTEGINRFQIAASSAGVQTGELAGVLPVVRTVCSYDRPKGRRLEHPPISFGWLDHQAYRIAFARVGLPPSGGRPGNFAAHVLIAGVSALPASAIAESFGSAFWWAGPTVEELNAIAAGKRDFSLPQVHVSDLVREAEDDNELDGELVLAISALAHGVLTLPRTVRLLVKGETALFGLALRAVARLLPETLEGLSLSTYERRPAFPFQVMGTSAPAAGQRVCELDGSGDLDRSVEGVLGGLLELSPEGHRLRAAATQVTIDGAETRRESVWTAAKAIVDVRCGHDPCGVELAALLQQPEAFAYVCNEAPGRARVAAAVQDAIPGVRQAMSAGARRMTADGRTALYGAIIERHERTGELGGCAATADAIEDRAAAQALLDNALDRALNDERAALTLGADDTAALLERSISRSRDPGFVLPLLRSAAQHVGRCAGSATIPDQYIAQMLRQMLAARVNPQALAETLSLRPRVLQGAALTDEEQRHVLESLECLKGPKLQAALSALLPLLTDQAPSKRLREVVATLGAVEAGRCVAAAARTSGNAFSPVLRDLCDDLAPVLLRVVARRPREAPSDAPARLALELLTVSGDVHHRQAAQLLRALLTRPHETPRGIARKAAGLEHPGLRSALSEYALDRAVGNLGHPRDVTRLWHGLQTIYPDGDENQLLERLLRSAERRRDPVPSNVLLAWVAVTLLRSYPNLVNRTGGLRDSDLDDLARRVVAHVPASHLLNTKTFVQSADRRGRAWWRRLEAHHRKGRSSAH